MTDQNRLKMSDMKMTDQITGHEIALQDMKLQDMNIQRQELSVMNSRQLIHVTYVQISRPKRDNIQKSQSHVQQTIACKLT